MKNLAITSKIIRSDEFITSTVENEVVMMSLEKGNYYGLDSIGSFIWENISEPTNVETLCQKLAEAFDVGLAQCQTDVLAFLTELLQEDMIRIIDEQSG
ncbi:lasso peptide biosynthesis PqqD family chaperone [Candidatus Leptofilum sp.]|uniref:lasso peptide biosynthesis PqqD family chaperone n=1 Tax=Candidatus Leptofilum sp. TaxID=3241576 RepID=UPI003B5A69B1